MSQIVSKVDGERCAYKIAILNATFAQRRQQKQKQKQKQKQPATKRVSRVKLYKFFAQQPTVI